LASLRRWERGRQVLFSRRYVRALALSVGLLDWASGSSNAPSNARSGPDDWKRPAVDGPCCGVGMILFPQEIAAFHRRQVFRKMKKKRLIGGR